MTVREYRSLRAPPGGLGPIPLTAIDAGPLPFRPGSELRAECIGMAAVDPPEHDVFLARTDGWISLPDGPRQVQFHPDSLGPSPFTTFVSGYRNVTGLGQRAARPGGAQYPAPVLWVDPHRGAGELRVAVAGPEPEPRPAPARILLYAFRVSVPGAYLYRLRQEDAGHLHPGTTGILLVRPRQNGDRSLYPSGKYAYDDGDGSTGHDREFVLILSELSAQAHWSWARGRAPSRDGCRPDFALLNGRAWPDTLVPSGSVDPFHPLTNPGGDPAAPAGNRRLRHQPCSSLVTCNAGERVLLRFANLGSRDAAMRLDGPRLHVVGAGASPAGGRTGTRAAGDEEHAVALGPGELVDAVFTAPPHSGRAGPDRYALRNPSGLPGDPDGRRSGQRTEVRVYPAGALPPQELPNT